MVGQSLSLGRNGVQNWLLLRVAGVIVFFYFLYVLFFISSLSSINYFIWRGFFVSTFNKIFTTLTLISIVIHGWIGAWQVITDYTKSVISRIILQLITIITLIAYLIYGTAVVWTV